MNALHWSVYKGHESLVNLLLQKCNPNTSDSLGRTPMYFACIKNNVILLLKLLKAGASPWNLDYRDYFFLTKSMVAKDLLKKA